MTTQRIDAQVEAAAALATSMALDLTPESRATLIGLRASGWRACCEFSFDADGFGFVFLTAVSPEGERRAFGQVAFTGAH
jgi:uncharacterized protein (AIM24 family)